MGSVLFIRVSAATTSEEDIRKHWPILYGLVWGNDGMQLKVAALQPVLQGLPHGVIELARNLAEGVQFGVFSKEVCTALDTYPPKIFTWCRQMDAALACRDVAEAHDLTYTLEDMLDKMERAAKVVS